MHDMQLEGFVFKTMADEGHRKIDERGRAQGETSQKEEAMK
jgi:hypothetical protein